ncbi:hypothetical protein MUK42_11038 [Musa troglodytarum]|uniref:Uncharacterized protein n=1 Tax=Musa troglodytarum TaxID=320322 RepID=A0A9E7L053_9LILI|nr:hypothetical protein MUK42_11038 [Musa troglodytarum]
MVFQVWVGRSCDVVNSWVSGVGYIEIQERAQPTIIREGEEEEEEAHRSFAPLGFWKREEGRRFSGRGKKLWVSVAMDIPFDPSLIPSDNITH